VAVSTSSPFSFLPNLASGKPFWPFAPFWPLAATSDEESSPPAPLAEAASAMTTAVSHAIESAQAAPGVAQPLYDYLYDAWQRSVLFLDVLRERGNQTYVHEQAGMPPVLAFDYEVIVDGRELADPCNYALLRIKPEVDAPTDPRMRPFVVIDPRAGHGPGIAGFKMDSEVGIALRKGHPCYFVTFFPVPCETQTIQSVAQAEAVFIQRVRDLHPDADGLPFIIGNCQGGWAAALLAASAPALVGPLMLAGSPLSYWAGVRGKNPMRYSGGMLGGSWMSSLAADLGDGRFDGAHLVQNFENLNPANTYWGKLYNLYASVDTERERFLEFERWWGGHFQLNRAEIDWIVQNLFVGNHLTRNEVFAKNSRSPVDLRNIRTPIIVLASWGDNITPPQQALNWIPDLYASVDEIVANEQVIVYCLHDKVGHLGIFVSASVANKEHTELFSALDLIDVLPPGLYEAKITDSTPEAGRLEALEGRYEIRFELRTIDDILALDDGRDDEQPFEVVRRFAENNQRIYDLLVSPFVRASSNALSAHVLRESHPSRVERSVISDANPALGVLPSVAEAVRAHRKPVAPDNPFTLLEKQASASIEASWDAYRDMRDAWIESAFYNVYTAPWMQAWVGVAPNEPLEPIAPPLMALRKELAQYRLRAARAHLTKGSLVDAFMRIAAYIVDEMHTVQYRPFQRMRELAREYLGDRQPSIAELKEAARRQGAIVQLDPQAAIDALPEIVPDMKTRRALLAAVYRIATVSGPLEGERRERYRHVQRALGVEPGSEKTGLPPLDGGGSEGGALSGGAVGGAVGGAAGGGAVSAGGAGGANAAAQAAEPQAEAAPAKVSSVKAAVVSETVAPKKAPVAAKTARRSRAAATPTATRAAGTTATRRRATRSASE
jgi:pimeloyl-ACP methyl ester carboxylesterase